MPKASRVLPFRKSTRSAETWRQRQARFIALKEKKETEDPALEQICPDGKHQFEKVREGVRWCPICNLWEVSRNKNLIYFPVNPTAPVPNSPSVSKIGEGRKKGF